MPLSIAATTTASIGRGFLALIVCLFLQKNAYPQVLQLNACPQKEYVARIRILINNTKDSLILKQQCDSIKKFAESKEEKKLVLYTDLFFLQKISFFRNIKNMRLVLLQNETYFTNSQYTDITATFNFIVGNLFYEQNNFEQAFHYFIQATDKMEKKGYENIPLASGITSALGGFYANFEDYPAAIKFTKIALLYSDTLQQNDLLFLVNNIGFYYLKMQQFDSAANAFKQVMEQATKAYKNEYFGIASSNFGNTLRLQTKYKEALPYLYTDILLNEKNVTENAATSCLYAANCLLQLDSVSKAKVFLNKAEALVHLSYTQSSYYPTYYETSALFYKKTANFQMANRYQDSLLHLKDSLKNLYNTKVLMATTLKEKEEKYLAQSRLKDAETSNTLKTRNIIFGALLGLFIAIFYAKWQQASKVKLRTLQQQQFAAAQLAKAQQDLVHFVNEIQEKNEVIEKIYAKINEQGKEHKINNYRLDDLLQSPLLTDEGWLNFKKLFEQVYPGYIADLATNYPELSPAETRLLVLQKMSISTKEMASMLGISQASIRTAKYRLRKKIPGLFATEEDLSEGS